MSTTLDFFQKVIRPRNNLHHAVLNALQQIPSIMPILRALGLIDKFVTGPWMAWQGENPMILEASPVFYKVLEELQKFEVEGAVRGDKTTSVFGTQVKVDQKFEHLTKQFETDQKTAEAPKGGS